jgi:hypothetical protein
METVKVDVRKLQMLNDRINQCIDALGQVRLSVHGLSHTAGASPVGVNPINPINPIQPFGNLGGYGNPIAYGDPRLSYGMPAAALGGLAHSAFPQTTPGFGQQFGQPFGQPFSTPLGLSGGWGPFGGQVPPFATGLSHTAPEIESAYARPLWADPFLAVRVAQTFPYANLAVPPVVYL